MSLDAFVACVKREGADWANARTIWCVREPSVLSTFPKRRTGVCRSLRCMNAPARPIPTGGHVPTFPCPKCRQAHPWSAEHAGKTARCPCGHAMKIPVAPHDAEDEGPQGRLRPP